MKELLPVGCVIMASGASRRFGSNKLLADFCGEPMLCRAFAATDTPRLSARIVVTRSDEVAQLCRSRNVPVLLHDLPGRNDTVRLGLSALLEQVPELFGCMFLPGDQPLLCRETVEAMAGISGWDNRTRLERQKETEREIFRLGFRVRNDPSPLTGSPVLFEKGLFQELLTLPQGMGGSVLLRKYPTHVHTVYIADHAAQHTVGLFLVQLPRFFQSFGPLIFSDRHHSCRFLSFFLCSFILTQISI